MSFRRVAPSVLVAAVIVVITVVSIVSNIISHRMASSFEESQYDLMSQILKSNLRGAESRAIASAEMIAAIPSVQRAFAARDREGLLALAQPAFALQKEKYGISQAQFHLAPAVSFLRVHNPAKFGEDQSNYRNIVVEVNRTNAIRKGIEITTSGIGIFGTRPMTDESGKHVGSFEMAFEFGPLLDELKNAYGVELAFFVDEKTLRENATALTGDVYNDQNRFGSHINFYSTHAVLLRSLVSGDDLNIHDEAHFLRESADVPYGVLLQPIYNYAGKQIGVVAMAKNFGATRSADGQALVWQTLLGVLAAVLLIGLVRTVIRGMLLRPLAALTDQVSAAAEDESAPAITAPESSCEELSALAAQCERLRGAQGRQSGTERS